MSTGEPALRRSSKDISRLRNALILINVVKAGLHPHAQRQLRVELQRLALRPRNKPQITVISHSPVILESVPDGDARAVGGDVAVASARYDHVIRRLYLPGDGPPDEWVYTVLEADPARCAVDLGAPWLAALPIRRCQHFDNSADKPANITAFRRSGGPPTTQARGHCAQVVLLASDNELAKVFADRLVQASGNAQSHDSLRVCVARPGQSLLVHVRRTVRRLCSIPKPCPPASVLAPCFSISSTLLRALRASVLERNAWRENPWH